MIPHDLLREHLERGRPYDAYVRTGSPAHQEHWARTHARVALSPDQRALVASFTRRLVVLVTSGTWCGDCAAQCPILARIADANHALLTLRFLDRDANPELAERVRICGGLRVPTAIFMNEDLDVISVLGDRTLSRYRAMAARQLGASCPLPGAPVPDDELAATIGDWVGEFERVHLVARLSPKLRERHED